MATPNKINHKHLTAGIVAAIACSALVGWSLDIPRLVQWHPTYAPMQVNTALLFLLCCIAVFSTRVSPYAGFFCFAIAALTIVEYCAGFDFGIDELFMSATITVQTAYPGRMAPNTALAFLLFGVALMFRNCRSEFIRDAIETSAAATFVIGAVGFAGYVLRIENAYGWGAMTRMSVHTALSFVLLSSGLLIGFWYNGERRGD